MYVNVNIFEKKKPTVSVILNFMLSRFKNIIPNIRIWRPTVYVPQM